MDDEMKTDGTTPTDEPKTDGEDMPAEEPAA